MFPANDNDRSKYRTTTFREKVVAHYRRSAILPGSASLLATYYMSALIRAGDIDPDEKPFLTGCKDFGAEPSPRSIVASFIRETLPEATTQDIEYLTEKGIESMHDEMRSRAYDIYGLATTMPTSRRHGL